MAFVTIDVEPEPRNGRHFSAVIRRGDEIIGIWAVDSKVRGEREVLYALEQLVQKKLRDRN